MRRALARAAFGWACLTAATAAAQDFPSRPISLVMPYAAGGTIGSQKIASAAPDGYNLLMIHISAATNPALYPNLKYDQLKDFQPIGLVVESPSVFVAKKDFPPKDFGELVAYAKASREKVNYAHAGIGSASHLCSLLFMKALGTKVTSVAYRGSGPAMNDLVAGQVDMICDQTVNVLGHVEAGAIKAYAVTTKEPVPSLPKLPTVAASGLPGFDLTIWYGMWAPKNLPTPVLDKLTKALHAALQDKTIRERMQQLGANPVALERATPDALQAHLKAETEKWGPIIREAGIAGQ